MSLHIASFFVAFALICVHEMDAMQRHEWRIFPGLSLLDDDLGRRWFLWLHIPLFFLVACGASTAFASNGNGFSYWFSLFCVVHALVHWAFEWHPKCEFKNLESRFIIWSCGLFGAASLVTWSAKS